jgi:hypothetical protein
MFMGIVWLRKYESPAVVDGGYNNDRAVTTYARRCERNNIWVTVSPESE